MTDSTPIPAAPAPIDWTDPCQKAAALTNAYYKLLAGEQEIEIQTRTLDAQELVRFAPSNLDALRSEMQDAQDACAAAKAGRPQCNKRFAIRARFNQRPMHRSPFWVRSS